MCAKVTVEKQILLFCIKSKELSHVSAYELLKYDSEGRFFVVKFGEFGENVDTKVIYRIQ